MTDEEKADSSLAVVATPQKSTAALKGIMKQSSHSKPVSHHTNTS